MKKQWSFGIVLFLITAWLCCQTLMSILWIRIFMIVSDVFMQNLFPDILRSRLMRRRNCMECSCIFSFL